MKLDEMDFEIAEYFVGRWINLKHLSTGHVFMAWVDDSCFEDQKGLIFQLRECDAEVLKSSNLKTLEKEDHAMYSIDGRDIFDGRQFELATTLETRRFR